MSELVKFLLREQIAQIDTSYKLLSGSFDISAEKKKSVIETSHPVWILVTMQFVFVNNSRYKFLVVIRKESRKEESFNILVILYVVLLKFPGRYRN